MPNNEIRHSIPARFGICGFLHRGDVALVRRAGGDFEAGEVYTCISVFWDPFALLSMWRPIETKVKGVLRLHQVCTDRMELVPLEDILDVCIFKRMGDVAKTIVPFSPP